MVIYCCVPNCYNNQNKCSDVSFYRFPKENIRFSIKYKDLLSIRKEAWLKALRRDDASLFKFENFRICSKHFISGKPSDFREVDNPDWIPSIEMGYINHNVRTPKHKRKRCDKFSNNSNIGAKRKLFHDLDIQSVLPLEYHNTEIQNSEDRCENSTQTVISGDHITYLENEISKKNEEISKLKKQIQIRNFDKEFFEEDKSNIKLKYYTGLPTLSLFYLILNHIEDFLNNIKVSKLTNFQKLLLVLMKLRLNLDYTDLGHRFNIKPSTVSSIFKRVIICLEYSLRYIIHWPDRESLRTIMPDCFKSKFGDRVSVIVDCFEIFTQRPSLAKAKVQSYSLYKSRYTVKYLLGITPQGFISFLSDGYGGRTSDKCITEKFC